MVQAQEEATRAEDFKSQLTKKNEVRSFRNSFHGLTSHPVFSVYIGVEEPELPRGKHGNPVGGVEEVLEGVSSADIQVENRFVGYLCCFWSPAWKRFLSSVVDVD